MSTFMDEYVPIPQNKQKSQSNSNQYNPSPKFIPNKPKVRYLIQRGKEKKLDPINHIQSKVFNNDQLKGKKLVYQKKKGKKLDPI